jgi:hypothetical protein
MLNQSLMQEKKLHPVGKTLGTEKLKKGVCHKIFYKMQFIKYNTGMRIYSNQGPSQYKLMTYEGILLLIFTIAALVCFIIDASLQVGLQKSSVFRVTDPLDKL